MARARQNDKDRKDHARRVCKALERAYPEATCALVHSDPYQLLVATILSAQCTDVRVNMVTPELFRRFPDAASLARADPGELEALIRSTGFFRAKARNLLAMARQVVEDHGGDDPARPRRPDRRCPGVGRKTANVVLGTAFGIASGVVVDTHVKRLARRLGLRPRERLRSRSSGADAGRPARAVGRSEPSPDPARPARLPGAAAALRGVLPRVDLPQGRRVGDSRGEERPSRHARPAARKGRSGSTAR